MSRTKLLVGGLLVVAIALVGFRARRAAAPKAAVRLLALEGESRVLPPPRRPLLSAPSAARLVQLGEAVLDVGGASRRYLLVTPRTIAPGTALPLVLVFHGDGGSAASFHRGYPFERGSGDAAVLAYLDGIGNTWDLETRDGNRDVAFVRALLADLTARLPIDPARVFATGYSSGGFFANVLACRMPDTFRAIASNAGGAPYGLESTWPNGYPRCEGQKPVAMLALHGRSDLGVTFDSGRFSAEYWAYVNGCKEDEMEPTTYDECRAYRGCNDGRAVALCDIPGLGHWVWDRAAEATWTFFERQSAP